MESASLINWGKTSFFSPGKSYILADASNDERDGSWLSSCYFVFLIKGMGMMKQEMINTQRKDRTHLQFESKINQVNRTSYESKIQKKTFMVKSLYGILI